MSNPPAQLAVLSALEQPRSIAQLAQRLERSPDTIRTAVQSLQTKRLVKTHTTGRKRIVHPNSSALVTRAKILLHQIDRPDWSSIFHGDRPLVLHVLHKTGRPPLTTEILGKSRRTVYQIIEDMARRGVLQIGSGRRIIKPKIEEKRPRIPGGGYASTGAKYRINARLAPLIEFLQEADRASAHTHISELDPEAQLIWHLGPELLYATTPDLPIKQPGGPTALEQLGIDLITTQTYHHVSIRTPTPSDAILQTLIVDPQSRINRSYAALAYEKTRPSDLHEKALIYGLEIEAQLLESYVSTKGQTDTGDYFLPWKAHERYRTQYGI